MLVRVMLENRHVASVMAANALNAIVTDVLMKIAATIVHVINLPHT